jgi:hypothetical protein
MGDQFRYYKEHRGYADDKLPLLHTLLMRRQRTSPPLSRRTTTEPSHLP